MRPLLCRLGIHRHWKALGREQVVTASDWRQCLVCGFKWSTPPGQPLRNALGMWRPSVGVNPPQNPFEEQLSSSPNPVIRGQSEGGGRRRDGLPRVPDDVEKAGRKPPPDRPQKPPTPPPPPRRSDDTA